MFTRSSPPLPGHVSVLQVGGHVHVAGSELHDGGRPFELQARGRV